MQQVRRDGVALFYEEAGDGEPPVLLVHGWCCDHAYFAPQVDHFTGRGHRVVVVDLRGHGESDAPRQGYTIDGFADDVAWMCGELGLEKPVVVGHSMGGIAAFDLATRYPALPAAIVMLDAAVVLPGGAHAAIQASWRSRAAQTAGTRCAGTWRTPSSSQPTMSGARSVS